MTRIVYVSGQNDAANGDKDDAGTRELAKQFDRANDLLAAGNLAEARKILIRIDARYGGLAAPRSMDLAARNDAMK